MKIATKKIQSIRDLAKKISRPTSTVNQWLKHADCPVRRNSPWTSAQAENLLAWRASLTKTDASVTSEIRTARQIKLAVEVRLLDLLNSIAAGEFVSLPAAAGGFSQAIIESRQGIFGLIPVLVAQPGEIPRFLAERLTETLSALTKKLAVTVAAAKVAPLALDPKVISDIRRAAVTKALNPARAKKIPRLVLTPTSDLRVKKLASQIQRIQIETAKRRQGLELTVDVQADFDAHIILVRDLFDKIKTELPPLVAEILEPAELDREINSYLSGVFTEFSDA